MNWLNNEADEKKKKTINLLMKTSLPSAFVFARPYFHCPKALLALVQF